MKGAELLADLVSYLARSVRREVEGLSYEELTWQPDAEGNSIAILMGSFGHLGEIEALKAMQSRAEKA